MSLSLSTRGLAHMHDGLYSHIQKLGLHIYWVRGVNYRADKTQLEHMPVIKPTFISSLRTCIAYFGIREESATITKSASHCPIKMLGEPLTLGALIPKK